MPFSHYGTHPYAIGAALRTFRKASKCSMLTVEAIRSWTRRRAKSLYIGKEFTLSPNARLHVHMYIDAKYSLNSISTLSSGVGYVGNTLEIISQVKIEQDFNAFLLS